MQMYRHVRAVNGENERIFASVASGIAELGLLRRYVRENRSIDSFQYVGAMNGVLFDRRFEKTLLKNLPKKRIIIMDNAAFHPKELLV